jgi:repressor LexA
MTDLTLTARQREILDYIERQMRERGYPPSVREIGEAVGLTSPSTVHSHLASLQRLGFLRRDPTKPRAIEVRYDPLSGAVVERRPVRHVPLVGDVAAGTDVLAQENVEETAAAALRLHRRGRPVHAAGARRLDDRHRHPRRRLRRGPSAAHRANGDIVVAGIPGGEATVKTFRKRGSKIELIPSNSRLTTMVFDADEVQLFGKVVTVLRRLRREAYRGWRTR